MRILVLILLFAVIAISQINTITDADIFCHLKTGEYILKNFSVPRADIFSYTLGDQPWVDHSWLFQALIYIVFSKFSWLGVNILKSIVVSLCFFILLRLLYSKYRKISYYVFFALLGVLAFGYRSLPRPEIFSYLFACLFFYIIESEKRLYILPILQVLWVNMHGYFIVGPIMILVYAAAEIMSGNRIKAKKLGVVFAATCLACFVNPYFYQGALYPIKVSITALLSHKDYNQDIRELAMPAISDFNRFIFFWVLGILSSVTFLINLKKARLGHVFIFLVSFAAGYSASRNIPFFVFLAMPLAVINLNEAEITRRIDDKKNYIFLILAICGFFYLFASSKYYIFIRQFSRKTESGIFSSVMPQKGCDFLEVNKIRGRIFNNINYGHYISYRFYPERRIFIDMRTELYGNKIYNLYSMAHSYPREWERISRDYDFNAVFLGLSARAEKLIKNLYAKKEWALVYYDDMSIIFLRDSQENKEAIEKFRIDFENRKLSRQDFNMTIGAFFEKIGEHRLAEEVYSTILKAHPGVLIAANHLAEIYIRSNRFKEALNILDNFLKTYPDSAELYCTKGMACLENGMEEEGFTMLQRAVTIDPYIRKAAYALGSIYFKRGDIEKAERQFTKYINLDPYDARAHRFLGDIYKQKGLLEKADKEYNEADRLEGIK